MFKLAIKVDKQIKERHSNSSRFLPREISKSRGNSITPDSSSSRKESTSKPPKQERTISANRSSTFRCFKCQGIGHIVSERPNRKIVSLMEEADEDLITMKNLPMMSPKKSSTWTIEKA